jgi:hypothetical protein
MNISKKFMNALNDWLRNPCVSSIPCLDKLSPPEISRVLSTVAIRNLGTLSDSFWDQAVERIITALEEGKSGKDARELQASMVSSVHVIDRIASHAVVPRRLDHLIQIVNTGKLSKQDALIASRAYALLGYTTESEKVLKSSHCLTLSNQSLFSLFGCGITTAVLTDEILYRLRKDIGSVSTSDILCFISLFTGRESIDEIPKTYKIIGDELTRRIELRCVSPHSAVRIAIAFSGLPPLPIHPIVLQASYALLLENRNYLKLSRDEISKVLHAMSLSEIENIVLTRCLIDGFLRRGAPECEDPRVILRTISAVSVLKTFIPPLFIHELTGDVSIPLSCDDLSTLNVGLLNLAGTGGAERKAIESVADAMIRRIDDFDLSDLASLLLLISNSWSSSTRSNFDIAWDELALPPIPSEALEITEKPNAALARQHRGKSLKDVKRRRLGMLDLENGGWGAGTSPIHSIATAEQADIYPIESLMKLIKRCLSVLQHEGEGQSLDLRDACIDILTGLTFMWTDRQAGNILSVRELQIVKILVDLCFSILANSALPVPNEDHDASVESSVVRTVANLAPSTAPFYTDSLIRISTVIS